jgi:ATPase
MINLEIMKYFTDHTMSVHLKEGCTPTSKVGEPGNVRIIDLDYPPIEEYLIDAYIHSLVEETYDNKAAFIELEDVGVKVIQMEDVRVTITEPPTSEAAEITMVRPVARKKLIDYKLPGELLSRIENDAQGILVAGAPGAGKSTFAQSLADFFAKDGSIVKTMEQPRDLQVGKRITQYAPIEGDMSKIADVLLLVRPDYTIYDELRRDDDFSTFADLRMGGVGMVGVVHATKAIDAIQRLIHRMELFMIPSVVDTVIFIEDGRIGHIYEMEMSVKVPDGMKEADLARPVIQVKDFLNKAVKFEIYTYGEQTVVMPINQQANQQVNQPVTKKIDYRRPKNYGKRKKKR